MRRLQSLRDREFFKTQTGGGAALTTGYELESLWDRGASHHALAPLFRGDHECLVRTQKGGWSSGSSLSRSSLKAGLQPRLHHKTPTPGEQPPRALDFIGLTVRGE